MPAPQRKTYGAQSLLNAPPQLALELDAQGVHLTGERLMKLDKRPLGKDKWVAASCHSADELRQAQFIDADFAVVSPVLPTQSHPGAACLGWDGLRQLAAQANMPVYALGGMRPEYVAEAQRHGAQGIAAVSSLWNFSVPTVLSAGFTLDNQ